MSFSAPNITELLVNLDFDLVFLDGERGMFDHRDIEETLPGGSALRSDRNIRPNHITF